MKICDLTQFYSPRSGGVKRYLHEKIRFIQAHADSHEHMLIVPGAATARTSDARSRRYTIASPLVSASSGYRALLNLRAIDEVLERERPDIIECADPYQLGWKTVSASQMWRVPAVAFYHSHFAEAYLPDSAAIQSLARRYTRALYTRFAATLVPSQSLAATLSAWGINNTSTLGLGVDVEVFNTNGAVADRAAIGVAPDARLLLYVGRLAPEKNTRTLCEAFEIVRRRCGGRYHLLVVGDGSERERVLDLTSRCGGVTWMNYFGQPDELAKIYRAADLFVQPGLLETFGLAALESQACGTPVVGFGGTRVDDVILHSQEQWARVRTAAALADAIEAMFSAGNVRALGDEAARRVPERFAWSRIFQQLLCIYEKVCANYSRPTR